MHHIVDHWSGGDGGYVYAIYSGLITFLCVMVSAGAFYWRHTCHLGLCPRWGRHDYAMDGTTYRICTRHHPTARRIRHQHILDHHYSPHRRV